MSSSTDPAIPTVRPMASPVASIDATPATTLGLTTADPNDPGRTWIELRRGQLIGVTGAGDVIVTGGPPASFARYGTDGI